jgi:hypothetical protein
MDYMHNGARASRERHNDVSVSEQAHAIWNPSSKAGKCFMKRAAIVVLFLAVNLLAADLSGRWSGSFKVDGGDHNVPQVFILKQDGNKLTGSGGPDENEQYPIENGKITGDQIGFALTTGEWHFTYNLKANGPTLSGDLELKSTNDRRTAKVILNRVR